MAEIYTKLELDLYYFSPFKLWNKGKLYGYTNPMAQKYINFSKIFVIKGHYGFGQDISISGWRTLNKAEL